MSIPIISASLFIKNFWEGLDPSLQSLCSSYIPILNATGALNFVRCTISLTSSADCCRSFPIGKTIGLFYTNHYMVGLIYSIYLKPALIIFIRTIVTMNTTFSVVAPMSKREKRNR